MKKFIKYVLLGLCSLIILSGAPLVSVLADDSDTFMVSDPEPIQNDNDGATFVVSDPVPFSTSTCGDFTLRYPECDWDNHQVREVWQDSCGVYQYRNVHTQPGQCGAQSRVSQPPAPAATNQNTNTNSNTNQNNTNVTNNIVNQNQNTSNSTSSSSSSSTANVTVTQPQGVSVRFATIDCPSGTTKKVQDNDIICEIRQPVRVEVAGVTQTQAKELPKTGLPLLAWAAGAFIPAGLGLKRFGKGISFDMEDNANYLWEERQYKVVS